MLDGRITYAVFARATRREFERLANHLLRRWAPPAWYVADDVVQELLLGAWSCMWDWCPKLGPTLSRYVVYNAMSHAKRALHKARGAKLSGTSDKNPSRFERPLSSFGLDGDGEAMAESILAEEPLAERLMIEREEEEARRAEAVTIALDACRTPTERAVILAIAATGDASGGAEVIYSDIDARIDLRLVSEDHALRLVLRTASAVVTRQAIAS